MAVDRVRARQRVEQAQGQALGFVAVAQAVEQHHEFVAADARHQARAAGRRVDPAIRGQAAGAHAVGQRRQQAVADRDQQAVAGALAERVVDAGGSGRN